LPPLPLNEMALDLALCSIQYINFLLSVFVSHLQQTKLFLLAMSYVYIV
jgi:hypothetical protein